MNTEILSSPDGMFDMTNATSGNYSPAAWFLDSVTGGHKSDSGARVTGYTTLSHCPAWQAVNMISGDIGQIPLRLVRNKFDEQRQHPAWNLLRLRPNELQTPSVFKETMMQWALVWGNSVAWVVRRGSRITDLIPLRPDFLWPDVIAFDDRQSLVYNYTSPSTGDSYTFLPEDVVHIQGLTSDGIWGYPLWQIAKNVLGNGLTLEKHGNSLFKNAARPSGVLKHPGKLAPEGRENLRRDWERLHSGAENAGKIAVLWEAMEFQEMSMTNIDAQWKEAMELDIRRVASLFSIPAYMLNADVDLKGVTNLEELRADYLQRTLTRWFNRLSEELGRKLLRRDEYLTDEYRFSWDTFEFLRGDFDTTSAVADRLIKAEVINRNEAREWFGLPPYEGGDMFGNPAINPIQDSPETTEEPPETDETDDESMENRQHKVFLFDLLAEHLALFFSHEQAEIEKAASRPQFVKWIEAYYCGTDPKVVALLEKIVGTSIRSCSPSLIDRNDLVDRLESRSVAQKNKLLVLCGRDDPLDSIKKHAATDFRAEAEKLILDLKGNSDGIGTD